MQMDSTTKGAKGLISEVVRELNRGGFEGGLYHYNKGECSCCYGLSGAFFEINENIPENWGIHDTDEFYYKISYQIADKEKANEFRKKANRIAKKYFGRLVAPAKDIFEAITINLR